MASLKQKIILNLCVTPWTVIPTALGVSLFLLSWIMPVMGLFGFVSILCGAGALLTNLIVNYDSITKKAIKDYHANLLAEKDRRLDFLDKKLCRDKDPRDQQALRDLRSLYRSFELDLQAGKVHSIVTPQMLQQVEQLFETCVQQLDQASDLWESSTRAGPAVRQGLMDQRNTIIQQVSKSVDQLAKVIAEMRTLKLKAKEQKLQDLGDGLRRSLEVARRTDESISEIDRDMNRFHEYET